MKNQLQFQVSKISIWLRVLPVKKPRPFTVNTSVDPLVSSTAPVFTGANIGSINGCTFQIFHGNVKIVQAEKSVDSLLKVTTMIYLSSHKKSVFVCPNFSLSF